MSLGGFRNVKYFFVNPTDHMPMSFCSLAAAREAAKDYIGKEDCWCNTVTSVVIYQSIEVEVVR